MRSVYGRGDATPPGAATAAANRANASSAVQEDSDSEVSADDEDDDRDEDETTGSGCAAVPEGPTAATRLRDLVASCSANTRDGKIYDFRLKSPLTFVYVTCALVKSILYKLY